MNCDKCKRFTGKERKVRIKGKLYHFCECCWFNFEDIFLNWLNNDNIDKKIMITRFLSNIGMIENAVKNDERYQRSFMKVKNYWTKELKKLSKKVN